MPSLTRPCLALPVPALICDSLSVPKLALHYPARLCTVQYCPSRHPCPVLLTMPDPVTFCPALFNNGRPFVALPGPSRPRLVLTVSLCLALSCPTLFSSDMVGLARTCPVLLALRWPYAASSAMIHPAWFYLILPGPALPYTDTDIHIHIRSGYYDLSSTFKK